MVDNTCFKEAASGMGREIVIFWLYNFFGRELAQMLFVLSFFGQAQNLDIRKHFLDLFSQGMMFSQKLTGLQEFF